MTELQLQEPGLAFLPGIEIEDSLGRRWIVVGVVDCTLGLKRSTWWRRLYWRLRRLSWSR